MKKCGIYIIKNRVNDYVYIGQSVDILSRWYAHKQAAKNEKDLSHHTQIHQAMNQIGINNFYMKILEECSYKKLNEKEIFWISYYDSYYNGYNMTLGGESNRGETNRRAILTEMQVVEIRAAYANHIPFREVYDKYKNVISKRGLQKVWRGETWKHIMMEVYTDENRRWHATIAKANKNGNKKMGFNNKQRACTEEEIQKMKELRAEGLTYSQIAQQVNRSMSVVRKYCLFQECKNSNKIASLQIKNVETGLVFESQRAASKWSHCDHHYISKYKNTTKSAGYVPTTGEPAHWVSI